MLNCDLGAEEYLAEELAKIDGVENAYLTFGAYDIIAKISVKDREEFDMVIARRVRKLARVVSTTTLSVVEPK